MWGDRSQKREAMVGGIVLGALVFTFLLIFFLADVRRAFIPTDAFVVLMPSAAGLRAGSLVWIAGKEVGEVTNILVRPPDVDSLRRVAVSVRVQSRYRDHIRRDSQARITSFRMIGDPVLDITPGSPTAPAIEPNDTLLMRVAGTPAAAIKRAQSLRASMQQLVAESRVLGTPVRERSAQIARMLQHLDVTKRELEEFTLIMQEGPLNTFSDPEFNRIMNQLATTMEELGASFRGAAERAERARSDAGPVFTRLAARADTIAQEIGRLQSAMQAGGGGLRVRAQTDTAIIKALHRAQIQLDSLIIETKAKPWRFWF